MTWNSLMVESDAPWRFWFSLESSLLTPLIWKVAPRVPVPLKLIDEPDDAVGLFWPEVGFSWKPVNVSASVKKFPWLNVGFSRISCAFSDPLISAFVVLIGAASAVTTTASVTELGLSMKLTTRVWLRVIWIFSWATLLKPGPEAVTV